MVTDKVLSMVGLAKRAGAIQVGAFLTQKAVREGECELIILASDTAINNKKKFVNASKAYDVPMIVHSTKEELSHLLGKKDVIVVGISDKNFAKGIMEKYKAFSESTTKSNN